MISDEVRKVLPDEFNIDAIENLLPLTLTAVIRGDDEFRKALTQPFDDAPDGSGCNGIGNCASCNAYRIQATAMMMAIEYAAVPKMVLAIGAAMMDDVLAGMAEPFADKAGTEVEKVIESIARAMSGKNLIDTVRREVMDIIITTCKRTLTVAFCGLPADTTPYWYEPMREFYTRHPEFLDEDYMGDAVAEEQPKPKKSLFQRLTDI